MSLRDRPKLSERLKGKTGDELFNEIKKDIEDSKKNWFSRSPGFRSFKGEGFPFDDDVLGSKSDAGIKSHLEDLAKKHPEFAGDLKCPPWGGSVDKNWEKAFTIPVAVEKEGDSDLKSQVNEKKKGESASSDNPGQSASKSASGDVRPESKSDQKVDNEPKRASSAPPGAVGSSNEPVMNNQEPRRFTSKIEITPVNPFEEGSTSRDSQSNENVRQVPIMTANNNSSNSNSNETGSPRVVRRIPVNTSMAREIPVANENVQNRGYESPQTGRKQPQVHHIPIYVEGRKDPVVPKNTNNEPPPERRKQFQQEQTPLKRKLDGNGNTTAKDNVTKPNQSTEPVNQNQSRAENREVPAEIPASTPAPVKTPMQLIQEVQQEVDNLTKRIEQFSSNSRTDKDYLYLDEMLTRNLIKLDTIEVEGNDELRTARKNVIRSIQKSIALLESKVPSSNVEEKNEQMGEQKDESNNSSSQMEVDNSDSAKSAEPSNGGSDGKIEKSEP